MWTTDPDPCGKAWKLSTKFRHWRSKFYLLEIEFLFDAAYVVL